MQSFSALLASAILVCGTHLLLIASSDYGRPESEQAPPPIATPAPAAAPVASREAIEVEVTAAMPERSHTDATLFAGDQTAPLPAPVEAISPAPAPDPTREAVETAEAEVPLSADDPSNDEASPSAEAQAPATEGTLVSSAPEPVTPAAEPADTSQPAEPAKTAEVEIKAPAEAQVAEAAAPVTTQPEPVTPEPVTPAAEPTAAPEPAEPAKTAEVETAAPAEPQMAEAAPPITSQPEPVIPAPPIEEAAPSTTTSAVGSEPEASSEPKIAQASTTAKSAQSAVTAEAEPVAPPVSPPKRKPDLAANAKQPKAPVKQVAAAESKEPEVAATDAKPRWTPMALAPGDKDTVAKPKLAPQRAESVSGYNAKIWSALARHKPRAGKAGSAVVTFAIGPAGALRSVRVSGSSGDGTLDQMALQAVRNAAPFPPPPNPASATYTIRIYFR